MFLLNNPTRHNVYIYFKDLSPDEFKDTKPNCRQRYAISIKNEKKTGQSKRETIFHVQRVERMNGFPTVTKASAIYLFIYCFHLPATLYLRRLPTLTAHASTECRWKLRSCSAQFTTNSTQVRQIAHYLTRCYRHTVGYRLPTVRFTTIHFYDTCRVGPSTPDLWCITVATQSSFLYLVRF